MKKYGRNERMGLAEYADHFRINHPQIPEQYYGKLAKPEEKQKEKEMETDEGKEAETDMATNDSSPSTRSFSENLQL